MLKIGKLVLIYALCNFGGGGFHVEVCVCLNFPSYTEILQEQTPV
jgi:hypothetical protein